MTTNENTACKAFRRFDADGTSKGWIAHKVGHNGAVDGNAHLGETLRELLGVDDDWSGVGCTRDGQSLERHARQLDSGDIVVETRGFRVVSCAIVGMRNGEQINVRATGSRCVVRCVSEFQREVGAMARGVNR